MTVRLLSIGTEFQCEVIMYLNGEQIKQLAENGVITDFSSDSIREVSYDLRIKSVYDPEAKCYIGENYNLPSGDTVFVSAEEGVNLPDDIMMFLNIRNSAMRMGYQIESPVYLPGHGTRVFFRVTNVSGGDLPLNRGESIVTAFFHQFASPVPKPYSGMYQDESAFGNSRFGEYHSSKAPDGEFQRKKDELEGVEKRIKKSESKIYERIILLMAIFVSLFTLINLNVGGFKGSNVREIIAVDLSVLGCLSFLSLLASFAIERITNTKRWILLAGSVAMMAIPVLLIGGV